MKLIVGLGNPGRDYQGTPHNIGFDVADALLAQAGASWKEERRWNAKIAKTTLGSSPVLLLEPQTFMNLSGQSVAPVAHYFGIAPEAMLVVSDDADLPLGRIRLRPDGGTGGHKGLASIADSLGTGGFARLRIGIGRSGFGKPLRDFVLARFPQELREQVSQTVAQAVLAAQEWVSNGINEAMNRFNSALPPAQEKTT